jgi:hypothetical protein
MENALSRSPDVVVNITKPSAETATDMSVGCVLTKEARPSSWGVTQIVGYYLDFDAFAEDWTSASPIYKAAQAFFSQSPRPSQFAVCLVDGDVTELEQAVGTLTFAANATDGDVVTIGTRVYRFKDTLAAINDVSIGDAVGDTLASLEKAIEGTGTAGVDYYAGTLPVTTVTAAVAGSVATITAVATGTAGEAIALAASGTNVTLSGDALAIGGTHASIADYAATAQAEAVANGKKIFAWSVDNTMRNATCQKALADWTEAGYLAVFLVSNSVDAYNAQITTDIGSLCKNASLTGACVFYSENASEYPEVAAMSIMLSTDFAGINTTKTLKFKTAVGITASSITASIYNALNAKNYNMVSRTGNITIITREGKNSAAAWYTDEYVGIQNFREEIQVAVFNVLVAKKKVPYTVDGQLMLKNACDGVCQRYVNNLFFAERPAKDDEGADVILPAYSIVPGNLALATASDRAQRIAPPIAITCYLAGAIHKVTLNIDMIQ